ncbi:MAG: ABC transporter substrate-binding protein [Actinomycetota bacterium]
MHRRRSMSVISLALALSLVAAACGGDDDEPTPAEEGAQRGGVFRAETDGIAYTSGFDPTGEYLGLTWTLLTSLVHRTLVTYRHTQGAAGQEVVPDLATDLGEISEDGLTYTFTLKDGIEFGPPVNREITSADIEYAFERIATESVVAQYPGYYEGAIEGLKVGKAPDDISGIETPDEKTIVFHLTEPTDDFLFRLTLPATGPIPEEVASCFTEAGEYGRFLISSGPYMIEGSDQLDVSSCDTMEPISGFDPDDHLYFVRNPNYDPGTDEPEVRANYFNELRIDLNTNTKDIYNRIEAGEIDGALTSGNPPPDVLRRYSTDPELRDRLKIGTEDRTWYFTMNLTVPPFDDIHVRKAANLVMDKEALRRAWGGEISGDIATHIQPPAMTGGSPTAEEYDPYPYDVEAAKEEMSQSKYDSDGDGVCDDPVCENILVINRNTPPWTEQEPVVQDSLSQIGLDVNIRALGDNHYTAIQTVANNTPMGINPSWGKDYADPASFVGFLFDGRLIQATGNTNYSLVGLTEDQATELGVDLPEGGVPNVDADIDQCKELDGDEANQCWIDLDMKLMEEIVPWVPYLWPNIITTVGPAVTAWDFDQFMGQTAWSKVAIDPSKQQ